jgi:ActR/RegA family two-component response regulator
VCKERPSIFVIGHGAQGRTAKVLLSNGYRVEGQAREIIKRGCCGFMQKPFTMNDLSAKLQGLLPAN